MNEKVGKEKSLKTLNRREFVKKSAIAAGTVLAASNSLPNLLSTANAASRDHILIGRPNPATGPIADTGFTVSGV